MKLGKVSYAMIACLSLTAAGVGAAEEKEKSQSSTQQSQEGKVSAMDKAWAKMSAAADMAEIRLSKVAQEKGTSEQVKQHAAKMIEDHTKSSQELKQIASQHKIDLKVEIPEEKKEAIQEITQKSGAEFDQAYMDHQLAAHRMAVAHYQNGAELLKNQELQSFAQKTLPIIQGHLSMLQKQSGHTTQSQQQGQPGAATAGSRPGQATQPGQQQPGQRQQQPQSGQVGTPTQQ
jgi:putative membrane protein